MPPLLTVVSGPPGSGKTTLATELARLIGCPAICRDQLKEGMVHAHPEITDTDSLNVPTNTAFFAVLAQLLRAGVSVVAEAAFQDKLWRPGLEPLLPLASIRLVHATVDPAVARRRMVARFDADPVRRRSHGDSAHLAAEPAPFVAVSLDVPATTVDTSDGYHPPLPEVVGFLHAPVG